MRVHEGAALVIGLVAPGLLPVSFQTQLELLREIKAHETPLNPNTGPDAPPLRKEGKAVNVSTCLLCI